MDYVDLENILLLNPMAHYVQRLRKHYDKRLLTKKEFMDLEHIFDTDKAWTACQMMGKESLKLATVEITRSVLHIYETTYPQDPRPREALDFLGRPDFNYSSTDRGYRVACEASHMAQEACDNPTALVPFSIAKAAFFSAVSVTNAYETSWTNNPQYGASAYSNMISAQGADPSAANLKNIREIILKYWGKE